MIFREYLLQIVRGIVVRDNGNALAYGTLRLAVVHGGIIYLAKRKFGDDELRLAERMLSVLEAAAHLDRVAVFERAEHSALLAAGEFYAFDLPGRVGELERVIMILFFAYFVLKIAHRPRKTNIALFRRARDIDRRLADRLADKPHLFARHMQILLDGHRFELGHGRYIVRLPRIFDNFYLRLDAVKIENVFFDRTRYFGADKRPR